jgi:pSer/pThr/pTyr-binding forkhead associated (FHA) protein/tetratricopeptide (TPR) repeat protein
LVSGRTYFLGRKEDSDVVLQPDPGISRTHVKIESTENYWTVQVLSQHIPITFEGKSLPVLVCKNAVTQFYVAPYQFELYLDAADAPVDEERPFDAAPGVEAPDLGQASSEDHAAPDSPPAESSAMPANEPAIDPEVSFHGNEEVTSDVYQGDEPYLKFMYATHSESIRLKGNKWVAGRDSIAQIHLDDRKASRQHFSIEKVGLEYFVKDLGSANGTLLNGQELPAHEVKEIKSGDILTVNQLTIIFELRDLAFSEKLKDLPLQVYSGPMILTSQEWDVASPVSNQLSVAALAQLPGTVQKIEAPKNRMRMILMAVAALVLVGGLIFGGDNRKPASQDGEMKSFEMLSVEDKKTVVDAYNAAQSSYKEGHFQNSLSRLAVIHKIIPFYKDSLELENRVKEAQETLRQQEFIAQQRRDQERLRQRVNGIVNDCRERYQYSVDVMAAKNCLNEAQQLDPENTDAQSLIAEIEMRLAQAEEAERRQKEYDDNVEKGRSLFYRAKNLFMARKYQDAITAFSNHLNSNLPDPDGLRQQSQRGIASLEAKIKNEKGAYMTEARRLLDSGNHRDAIGKALQAQRVDPNDYEIANFLESTRRELNTQMSKIFMDATLEEKLGNGEIAKNKWKEIIKRDIPNGFYY